MALHRNTFFTALSILLICLTAPQSLFANGGDDPIARIDIFVQEETIKATKGERISASFTLRDLKEVNVRKGMRKPDRIAIIAARYVNQLAKGAAPSTGWKHVLRKGLRHDWCIDCRGGTTVLNAKTIEGRTTTIVIKITPSQTVQSPNRVLEAPNRVLKSN